MTLDPRGSVWSRWDLHIHTPASLVHQYSGGNDEAWERFLEDLEALPSSFRVVGINDYLFLDGYERVLEEKKIGRLPNIDLVLPVIELRLNVFGGTESRLSRVNYHVLFSDDLDPQEIREQFLSGLSRKFNLSPKYDLEDGAWSGVVTRDSLADLGNAIISSVPDSERSRYGTPLQEGFNNLTLPLEGVQELLSSRFLKGRYVTAVGKTEWADIKWKDGAIADKKTVVNSADCLFTAAESPAKYHRSLGGLRSAGVNHRLLDCSDAHHFSDADQKDRIGNCVTWVKADPTFGGLLQALEEFDQRIFVGGQPPELRRVSEHATKYIDKVRISKTSGSKLPEQWFDTDLPLNSGLVAVIGNKGSGKSALAEVIGLVGGTPHEGHFSFLTTSKFRDSRKRLAAEFIGEVVWRDGESQESLLSQSVQPDTPSRVQHLPQRYLESLCNEVPSGDKTEFDRELERIIFSHLPVSERFGAQTLEEVTKITGGAIDSELAEQRENLTKVNHDIVALEHRSRPEEFSKRRSAYRSLRKEWMELRKNPPEEVPEPDESDPAVNSTRDYLKELGQAHQELSDLLENVEVDLAAVRRDQADLASFRTQLEGLKREHQALMNDYAALLDRLGIEASVSEFSLETETLDSARTDLAESEAVLMALESGGDSDKRALQAGLDWIEVERESEQEKLSAPEEARESYLKAWATWELDVENLRGELDSKDLSTVLGARGAFFALRGLPEELTALRAARRSIAAKIHHLLTRKAVESAALYAPLQADMDAQDLPIDYQLSVGTSLVDTGFVDYFLGTLINRNIAGSFCGVAESERRLGALLDSTDFDDGDSTLEFLDGVDEHLRFDKREKTPLPTQVSDLVRKGRSVEDLYDWVFGMSYLSPRYGLMFGGKPIYQLSPGEKGTLLLVFFLLAEVDTRPLIIDQPEDNLDNNTVFRALVRCFHKAKTRRQVIIVTHNPNLAVVCDADQIIVATMDKAGPEITYSPGAIERPNTVEAVVDILEGTQPAFRNRSVKYALHLLDR